MSLKLQSASVSAASSSDACAAQRTGVNATAVAACGVSEPPAAVAARCTSSESGGGACGVVDEGASPSSAAAAASRLRRSASSARLTSRGLRLRVAKPRTLRTKPRASVARPQPCTARLAARTCRPARAAAAAAQPLALAARRAERASQRSGLRRAACGAAQRVTPPPCHAAAAQAARSRAKLPWTGASWRVRPSRLPRSLAEGGASPAVPSHAFRWLCARFATPAGGRLTGLRALCHAIARTRGSWRAASAADERAGEARPRQPAAGWQAVRSQAAAQGGA